MKISIQDLFSKFHQIFIFLSFCDKYDTSTVKVSCFCIAIEYNGNTEMQIFDCQKTFSYETSKKMTDKNNKINGKTKF